MRPVVSCSPRPVINLADIWEKIADVTLTQAATSITITGLDLATDKAYMLLFAAKNPTASNSYYDLTYNNDLTRTNYYCQYLTADSTTITSGRGNNPPCAYANAGQDTNALIVILRSPDGKPYALIIDSRDAVANIKAELRVHARNNTENVTRIDIVAQIVNAIAIGSKLILFRVRS